MRTKKISYLGPYGSFSHKDIIKFYAHLFGAALFTILTGSFFPPLVGAFEFWGINPITSQRLILLLDILISLAIAFRLIGWPSWKRFINHVDFRYRIDAIALVIFSFFFVILNSGLFLFIDTGIPLYYFFLNKNERLEVIKWTLIINSAIAAFSAIIFLSINLLLSRYYNRKGKIIPLWGSTLSMSIVPVFIGFLPIAVCAEQRFAHYVFVAAFAFILALLGILGYSHPSNKLGPWIAKVIFIMSITFCLFGFLMAMGALMWYLSGTHEPPTKYITFFSPGGYVIDWSNTPYLFQEYSWRWKVGFTWMTLVGIFFMELCPGLITVCTIFKYQLSSGK